MTRYTDAALSLHKTSSLVIKKNFTLIEGLSLLVV